MNRISRYDWLPEDASLHTISYESVFFYLVPRVSHLNPPPTPVERVLKPGGGKMRDWERDVIYESIFDHV